MNRLNSQSLFQRTTLIILGIILCLGAAVEVVRSDFLFQFSSHSKNAHLEPHSADSASESAAPPAGYTKDSYLILYDPDEEVSRPLADNIAKTLQYMKKSFELRPAAGWTAAQDKTWSGVILAFEDLTKLGSSSSLVFYVEQGGNVFLAERPITNDGLYSIYRSLGINSLGTPINEQGVKVTSTVLLHSDGLKFEGSWMENSIVFVELAEETQVLAETAKGHPLLWKHRLGQGSFTVFNGSTMHVKVNRGLIAGAISMLQPLDLYPIINTKLAYIDDFPAPFRKGTDPRILNEYGLDNHQFFREVWWPDMMKSAQKNDIRYTGVVIENYNDQVEAPFTDRTGEEKENLVTYGRELLKMHGEIGMHGYNHQSLVHTDSEERDTALDYGYNLWPSHEAMVHGISQLYGYIKSIFPKYSLQTYVPASNVLSKEGRQALKEGNPELRIIASVYNEDGSGRAYVQEFERASDGLLELPRITSGYAYTDLLRWSVANSVSSVGVFSHFIHPDDVLDKERNGNRSWKTLSEDYGKLLSTVHRQYPWLRAMTASEAGKRLDAYLNSDLYLRRSADKIEGFLTRAEPDAQFILRTDRVLGKLTNCEAVSVDEGVYLVKANSTTFEIGLDGNL